MPNPPLFLVQESGGFSIFLLDTVHSGRLPTRYPAQRNKTSVILLRSLPRNKSPGWLPSEPLRCPLRPALRAQLRDRAQSQQNNDFCVVRYLIPNCFPIEYTCTKTCRDISAGFMLWDGIYHTHSLTFD